MPEITEIVQEKTEIVQEKIDTQENNEAVQELTQGRVKLDSDKKNEAGLHNTLTDSEKEEAYKLSKQRLEKWDSYNLEKNLEKDMITVPGQNFSVVCWVGPSFKAKTKTYGFRIMGAFGTLQEAQKYAQKVNNKEPMYDTGIMEMNYWCLGYPDPIDSKDEEGNELNLEQATKKMDGVLNDFVVDYKTERENAHQLFEARKLKLRNTTKSTEDSIENSSNDTVQMGKPTEEMKELHLQETKKWTGSAKNKTQQRLRDAMDKKSLERAEKIEESQNAMISEIRQNDLLYENSENELDLNPCQVRIFGQEYAAVSYISSTGNNNRIPVCIKGVFSSQEQAENHIKKLIKMDDTYDILPTPLYNWIPCDPDLSKVKQIHTDERLNTLLEEDDSQREEALGFHSAVSGNREDVLQSSVLSSMIKGTGSMGFSGLEDSKDSKTALDVFKQTEEATLPTFSFQGPNNNKEEVPETKFKTLDEAIQKNEEKIIELTEGGQSEKEAKEKLRVHTA
jgi:hypothetical protein